jgi:predicted nucleic-acid-binding Zn-ribbon protein
MSEIKFQCPKCGSTEFEVSRRDLRPDDKMTCAKCGATDTYQRLVVDRVRKKAVDAIKKAFK